MHELSLCEAIAGVVKNHADGRHVDVVRVRIGALRQVVPESLSFCWSPVGDHVGLVDLVPAMRQSRRRGATRQRIPGDLIGCLVKDVLHERI